ncbi:DUF349 domain-containing protein [Geofilum rubicundum]|uniref:ATPase n=1 Tax=Geofilum rubicundum JCM 15548 TaxID=1236989 RepID=A0A0E9M104_9BACT|nr:DUF349 domain-containing protein [Geofilum rubicundum]GAO31233.1 hypothetical protein JCM15548_13580 [Geofilum rubicundum JCM 15548]
MVMESNELNKDPFEGTNVNADNTSAEKPAANEADDYSALDREALIGLLKQLLKEKPVGDIKEQVDNIRKVFDKASEEIEDKARKVFVESGEPIELFVHQPDELQKQFSALLFEYRSKRDNERQSQEQIKEKNLVAKYEVIEGIKDLLNRQESLNDTFQEFRDLQQKWRDIGPVPQSKLHDLWETFHLHVENFYNYIKINNELRDLDLKKNYELKIELCEKAEALMLEPSPVKAFKSLQNLHDQWREVGPVPRDKKEELWDRFKAVTAKINQRQQEHFESLKNQLRKNLEAKTELCEKAESLLEKELTSPKEWEEKSKQLIDLQQIWKTIGFAPKKENNLVYERFRKACDTFFNNKRDFFKSYKEDQQNNLQLKTELCIQAEAMKDSQDWKKATDEYIRIQKKWKEIGPVPRKQSDVVWKRFREACDYFFNRKKDFFSNIDEAQDNNLKLKEAIIAELSAFELKDDSEQCFEALQEFQRRWSDIGFVPIKEKDRVNQEFRNLINQKFDHLNLNEVDKNLQKFRNKLENWKTNDQFNEKIGQERNKIIIKLKQLENDIILWENNIGFFAKSKNSDALVRDFQHKIESGKRNIRLLNKKLDLIDEML